MMKIKNTAIALNPEGKARYVSLIFALTSTGAAFMIYEIVLLRELVIVLGGTVYASSAVLSAVMMGLFIGGYWLGSLISNLKTPILLLIIMELAMAATAIYIVFCSRLLQGIDTWIIQYILAFLLVMPTAILAGGELPVCTHLIGQVVDRESLGSYSGRLYAADTFGAMLGGLIGPLWLMGLFGSLKTTWIAGLLNVISAMVILLLDDAARELPLSTKKWIWTFMVVIMGILGIGVLMPIATYDNQLISAGIKRRGEIKNLSTNVVEVRETPYQRAVIVEHKPTYLKQGENLEDKSSTALYINGRFQADTLRTPIYYDESIYLTLLSHPNPENVLVIGCGDGGLLRAILADPRVNKIVQVEIDKNIIELSQDHLPEVSQRLDVTVWDDQRVQLIITDGRRYLKNTKSRFDLIVSDLPGPLEEATSTFYSQEFYRLVKNRLKSDGMFWTEAESPRSQNVPFVVARTVASVFGNSSTRLIQPISVEGHQINRGESVVIATNNPKLLHLTKSELKHPYSSLYPKARWINPNRHVKWMDEGKLQLRWNSFEISTDDRPTVLYISPNDTSSFFSSKL